MNKRKILIITILIILIVIILYVLIGTLSIKSKMNRYLTDTGRTPSIVESVKVKHSFLSLLLSYGEWGIEIKYYDEPDVKYLYNYKNNEIVFAGLSGGTKDKDEYKYVEKQFKGTIIEVYSNSFIIQPNDDEEIKKVADKISINGVLDGEWGVDSKVIVTYYGEILETYPAQIHAINIEINNE